MSPLYRNSTAAVITALLAITAIAVGLQAWQFVVTTTASAPTATVAAGAPTSQLMHQIAAAGLFGGTTTVADGGATVSAGSDSAWVLRGVFTGDSPEHGSAIIETSPGQSHLFRAGQRLAGGGGRLLAVYDDHVVLTRNGRRESLRFPVAAAKVASNGQATVPVLPGTSAEVTDPRRRAEIRERLELLRQRARSQHMQSTP